MINVLILGANGQLARHTTRVFLLVADLLADGCFVAGMGAPPLGAHQADASRPNGGRSP